MGIQDRDYYREHHANKNGMRYNRKNATYSPAEKLFSDAVCLPVPISVRAPKMHPVLIVLLTASICLAVFVILKLISKFV